MSDAKTTIYFDGSCPLCRAEVAHYARQDGGRKLDLVDVSDAAAELPYGLDRDAAMTRFHVRSATGEIVSGAAGFVTVWQQVPGWRWAAMLARVPGVTSLLELAYRGFLPLRPFLVRIFAALTKRRRRRA